MIMSNEKINLVAPWIEYVNKVKALFGPDPEVSKITYDNESSTLKIYIDSEEKSKAIARLLPSEVTFGNIKMHIVVIPSNINSPAAIMRAAFKSSPVLSDVIVADAILHDETCYVVFKNEVVQYYNDDIRDINGFRSTLYQELAKELLDNYPAVNFCTEAGLNPVV